MSSPPWPVRSVIAAAWGRPVIWVFTAALVVRLVVPLLAPSLVRDSDDLVFRYGPIAESLRGGDGFSRKDHPTAVAPPGYPLFIAATRTVLGPGPGALRLPLLLLDAATAVLVLGIGWIAVGRRVGILAGLAAALCPYSIYTVLIATSDSPFLFVHTTALVLLVRLVDRPSRLLAASTGVAFGFATLVRAVPLFLPPVLAVVLILVLRSSLRRTATFAVFLLVLFVATLAPWTIRNAVVFHRLVPIQTLGGYHLYMGTFTEPGEEFHRSARRIKREAAGSVSADPELVRDSIDRIRRHPARYARLVGRRLLDMWTLTCSGSYRGVLTVANGVLLLLAAVGVLTERRRIRTLLPLLAVVAYYVGLHSVLFALFRYMLPVLPILFVLASAALVSVWDRTTARTR